jgi:recombination protein RecT
MNDQANKPAHPMVVLRDQLNDRSVQFQHALPKHMPAERFFRVVLTAVQLNNDLLTCDRGSLFNSALRCAQDGLLPDGREAALVPFKNKVQYLPMYQGLLKKFRNSGQFKWVTTDIVYDGDHWEHWTDENGPHFKHIPGDDHTDKKKRLVYAAAGTKDGGVFIAPLSPSEIAKRRNMSRASREDAPWKMWTEEMEMKTAIRVLSRLLPMSSDLDDLIRKDEEMYEDEEGETTAQSRARSETARGATLDHFAGPPADTVQEAHDQAHADRTIVDHLTEPESPPSEQHSDDSNTETNQEPQQTAAKSETKVEPQQATAPDLLVIARERGRADQAKGMQRKATPIEYRDPTRAREALEWRAGWDEQQAHPEGTDGRS